VEKWQSLLGMLSGDRLPLTTAKLRQLIKLIPMKLYVLSRLQNLPFQAVPDASNGFFTPLRQEREG
jgi:hypothetical protein